MTSHESEAPATLLFNANVITLDPRTPRAEAVATRDGRIAWVGRNDDSSQFRTPGAKLIDCGGKTLVPGFNDAHCHIFSYAASLFSLDLSPTGVSSIEDIKSAIRERARSLPKGTWIRGTGYNEFYLNERRHPDRHDLDQAAPDHPVKLVHRSGHATVLNSLALKLVGISIETPEPDGGMIDRDASTAEPNGILYDMEDYLPLKEAGRLTQPQMEQALIEAGRKLVSLGITSVQDATPYDALSQFDILSRLKARREFAPRVWKMVGPDALDEIRRRGAGFSRGDDSLRLGAVKVILRETGGALYPTARELQGIVVQAHKAGFPVALHAVEETTVEAAIQAFEYAHDHGPAGQFRDRIEHCSVCPPPLLERLARLGALVVTQPAFIYYSGERYLAEVPAEQRPWLYRVRSFFKTGLRPAAGSDAPVVPPDPFVGICAAITRRSDKGTAVLPDEGVTALRALRMHTVVGAYVSGEEADKGAISPGKLADLVLLSGDPTRVPPAEIPNIAVAATFLGGQQVWP